MDTDTIRLVLEVAGVVFGFGVIYGEIKAMRKDISRLETKVEKHNSFDRRIIALETTVKLMEEHKQ